MLLPARCPSQMTAGGTSSQSEGAETQLDHFPLSLAAVFLSPFPLGPQPSSLRAKIPIYHPAGTTWKY